MNDGDNEPSRSLQRAREIVLKGLQGYNADVYLFGSRARGDFGRISDIDIAVLSETPIPRQVFSALSEAFEESSIPYDVDVVDLSKVDKQFREKVLKEGILWSEQIKG